MTAATTLASREDARGASRNAREPHGTREFGAALSSGAADHGDVVVTVSRP